MKPNFTTLTSFVFLGLTLGACGGANSAFSTSSDVRLEMKVTSESQGATALNFTALSSDEVEAVNAGVTFSEVQLSISEIRLKFPDGVSCANITLVPNSMISCENEDSSNSSDDDLSDDSDDSDDDSSSSSEDPSESGSAHILIEGPFVVNLLTGEFTPSLADLKIPAGTYEEIEFRVDDSEELNGVSLRAAGSVLNSDDSTRELSLALRFNEKIEFEPANGLVVEEGSSNVLSTVWNLDGWFEGVDIAACIDDGGLDLEIDGSLQIDEENSGGDCGDIEQTIKENIKNAGSVSSDTDDEQDDEQESEDD